MADIEIAAYNMETDISKMEAPTFSTIERNQPATMLSLDWDHKVNLVGKKVLNPMIHCCDTCLKPILIYGRMIPCKHVFCLGCAKQEEKQCPRCKDKVSKVEQAGLGSIFLCTHGGSRYGNSGCRRTYLSSRDLHAHINHRHFKGKDEEKTQEQKKELTNNEAIRNAVNSLSKASLAAAVAAANSANASSSAYASSAGSAAYSTTGAAPYGTSAAAQYRLSAAPTNHIAVINTRQSNLITVPIHGDGAALPETSSLPSVHPGYVPSTYPATPGAPAAYPGAPGPAAAYPAYAPYAGQASGAQPTPVTYPQTGPSAYTQPPPAYAYPGSYAAAPPPSASSQYSTGGQGAPPPFSSPVPGVQGYAPPAGYPGAGGGPPYQGTQWTRPPPSGTRPPPTAGHQNYYRR